METFLNRSRFTPQDIVFQQYTLNNGVQVIVHDAGVIEFVPSNYHAATSRHVLLSCGVHGNETAPIEICNDLVEAILAQTLSPTVRVQFQFANLAAMNIAERFVTDNLNRLFNGAHRKQSIDNYEYRRAAQLEAFTAEFFADCADRERKFHYDLHTAIRTSKFPRFAVYPFRHGQAYSVQQLQWLARAGIEAVLLSHQPTTTYSYYSERVCDAHAFTVELGKVMPFGQNRREDFAASESFLRDLLQGSDIEGEHNIEHNLDYNAAHNVEIVEQVPTKAIPAIFDIAQTILRDDEEFALNFAPDTPNFTAFAQGAILAVSGTEQRPVTVQAKQELIVFPNAQVAVGQRALLTVTPVALADLTIY
jgi:succinylglutamate desuccinylase